MMLVNFQTLLTYEQTKWLLSNWNGYDIAVNISPIIKRSVVVYKNNFYKYNGDIRIWKELDLTGKTGIINDAQASLITSTTYYT